MEILANFALAINAPQNRGGLLVAAGHTVNFLRDAEIVFPSPRLTLIRVSLESSLKSLLLEPNDDRHLLVSSQREKGIPVYGFFVDPPAIKWLAHELLNVKALAGLAVAYAMSRGEAISSGYTLALSKIFKGYVGGKRLHREWHLAAKAISQGEEDFSALARRFSNVEVRRFFLATNTLRAGTLLPTLGATPVQDSVGFAGKPAGLHFSALHEPVKSAMTARTFEPLDILQWQLRRAEFARFDDAMGLSASFGRLLRQSLRVITTGIANSLRERGFKKEFGLFAIYSLLFNLPPERTFEIPIGVTDAVCLDPGGFLHWEMAAATSLNAAAVNVPLPAIAVKRQQELLLLNPVVKTVGELCQIPSNPPELKEWLRGYDAFLKSFGDGAHTAWPSRFANSLGQVYLELSGRDILATICTLNFSLTPRSALHYAWVPSSLIQTTSARVYAELGLGEPIEMPAGYLGAGPSDVPNCTTLRQGWSHLIDEAASLLAAVNSVKTCGQLASSWSCLAAINALMFCVLTGHRAQRLERLTFGALLSSKNYVFISDKDLASGHTGRVIPISGLLLQTIAWQSHCVARLAKRLNEFGFTDQPIARVLKHGLPHSKPAFFKLVWCEEKRIFKRRLVSTGDLTSVSRRFWDTSANFGRKFWVTQLLERGCDRFLIRLLTFHKHGGAEPAHPVHWQVPAQALAALLIAMEQVLSEAELTAPEPSHEIGHRVSLRSHPLPRSRRRRDGLPEQSLARAISPQSITPSALELVEKVRLLIGGIAQPEHAAVALAVCGVVFCGFNGSTVIRQLVCNTPTAVVRIGSTPFLNVRLGDKMVPHPLVAPVHALLNQVRSLPSRLDWSDVQSDASRWLREQLPEFSWEKDKKAFDQLLQASGHWLNLHLPSLLNTCGELASEIPALSWLSYQRLTGIAPSHDLVVMATERPRVRTLAEQSLTQLFRLIHHWGSSGKNLGGEIARAKGLEGDLSKISPGNAGSPFSCVYLWARHEAMLIHARSPDHIQPSSLSTYISNLSRALESLSPIEDIRAWDNDDWQQFCEFVQTVNDEGIVEGLRASNNSIKHVKVPALLRFTRALASSGNYNIPDWILSSHPWTKRPPAIRSAAMVWVGEKDYKSARETLIDWLEGEQWLLAQCLLLLDWLEEIPSRISEPLTLATSCLTGDFSHAAIRENGFSILKTSSSARLVALTNALASSVNNLTAFTRSIDTNRKFLFLTGEQNSMEGAIEVHDLVRKALSCAVQDPYFVMHSTRASSIFRTISPCWEQVATSVLQLEAGPKAATTLFYYEPLKWCLPALAASRAGHAERNTLVKNYGAVWTVLRHLALTATLTKIPVHPNFLALAGIRADALRQARSRALRSAKSFDPWVWWTQHLAITQVPVWEDEGASFAATHDGTSLTKLRSLPSTATQPCLATAVRYVVKRGLGLDSEIICATEKISAKFAQDLEEIVDEIRNHAALTRRIKFGTSLRGQRADISAIDSAAASSWLSCCQNFDPQAVQDLWLLLTSKPVPSVFSLAQYPEVVKGAMQVMPSDTRLEFIFGQRHHKAELAAQLLLIGATVGTPNRDIGAIPRVNVVRKETRRNDVEKARLTVMMRLLTCSFVYLKRSKYATRNG